ncbi:hypothetical protein KR093_010215, partial [Drosophila rubida]
MRACQLIVLLLLITQGCVNGIDRIQLSPRLLYSRKDGGTMPINSTTIAVNWTRELLTKLGLPHLKSRLHQAKILEGNDGLLFEMQTYLYALEVKRAWDQQLSDYELYEELDRASMNCSSDCVNKDYELMQTELKF